MNARQQLTIMSRDIFHIFNEEIWKSIVEFQPLNSIVLVDYTTA